MQYLHNIVHNNFIGMSTEQKDPIYDYIVIGSGFGGSVSALRLAEKGYTVLVIEKGKWFNQSKDFPTTTWDLKKWFWLPGIGFRGLFKMTFFRHIVALSGVGVGGGSLVYANTLPVPDSPFFKTGSWSNLENWEEKLNPFYAVARKMLGVQVHPYTSQSDKVMLNLAKQLNVEDHVKPTEVGVYFGSPGKTVSDPYFNGEGPDRTGCILCGACMLGCRYNAKNTLDKNYLYLAQKRGTVILAEHEVTDVAPLDNDGTSGYVVTLKHTFSWWRKPKKLTTKGLIFSGGVIGTVPLLLKLKTSGLPLLSDKVGAGIRTNSESLVGITSFDKRAEFSDGIAIGSILKIDTHRSVEPVKYPRGSGFWRLFMAPMVYGDSFIKRIFHMAWDLCSRPVKNLKVFFIDDWSRRTLIMLYMESIDATLKLRRSRTGWISSVSDEGKPPTAFNTKAREVAHKIETIINGKAMVMNTETLFGIPTTAHILGGACMGEDSSSGVIDKYNRVFHYKNMLVCDGSAISSNPGVNPSLTITALTEHAMYHIPEKSSLSGH